MNQASTFYAKRNRDEHAVAAEETRITLPLLGGAITTRTITLFFVGAATMRQFNEERTYNERSAQKDTV